MPAKSKKQRQAMAIAEHSPKKLYKRNKGLKKMSKAQLHDFSSTSEKHLPEEVHPKRGSVAERIHRSEHRMKHK
jgi:hypothetical protein